MPRTPRIRAEEEESDLLESGGETARNVKAMTNVMVAMLAGVSVLAVVLMIMIAVLLSRTQPPLAAPPAAVAPAAPVTDPVPVPAPVPVAPLSGVWPNVDGKLKLIMAQDVDWPPYAYMGVPPESDFDVAGIGHDIVLGMGALCNWDVTVVQTDWAGCWNQGAIGSSLLNGVYHGCMTYTHTVGERNRFVEFSEAILQMNKPAGILTRLDADGHPVIDGNNNLQGVNVVDVSGWAPTADTLAIAVNDCNGQRFAGFNMLPPLETPEGQSPNDVALEALLDGRADAMWVYADQAYNYRPNQPGVTPEWNAEMWGRFGQPNGFAYIHTGMLEHTTNGTTLSMSKKGSGVADVLNPCLRNFMQTQQYYDICQTHGMVSQCFTNSHFPAAAAPTQSVYAVSTPELTGLPEGDCAHGYCPCPAQAAAAR